MIPWANLTALALEVCCGIDVEQFTYGLSFYHRYSYSSIVIVT